MLDSLSHENSEDFRQRYEHTYGFIHNKNDAADKRLVFLSKCTADTVQFTDKQKIPFFAKADMGVNFEFIPLIAGLYNVKDGMVYVSRQPARQWKRGIAESNTAVYHFSQGGNININFDIVSEIFNTPYNVKKRVEEWQTKDKAVALSRNFGLVGSGVYMRNSRIGKVNKTNRTISLEVPLFQQELSDLIRREALNFIVEEVVK